MQVPSKCVCVLFGASCVYDDFGSHLSTLILGVSNEEENLMESRILWNQRTGRKEGMASKRCLRQEKKRLPNQKEKNISLFCARGRMIRIYTRRYVRTWIWMHSFLMHDRDMVDMLGLCVNMDMDMDMDMHMDVICMYVCLICIWIGYVCMNGTSMDKHICMYMHTSDLRMYTHIHS